MTEPKKREIHRLSPKQSYDAVTWLKAAEIGPGDTHKTLAYRATEALKFLVTEHQMGTLLEVAERELVKTPPRSKEPLRAQTERIAEIEKELAALKAQTAEMKNLLGDTATHTFNNQTMLIQVARALYAAAHTHSHGVQPKGQQEEVDKLFGDVHNILASASALPVFHMLKGK